MHSSKRGSRFHRHGLVIVDLLVILTIGVLLTEHVGTPREQPVSESGLAQNVQVLRSALDLYKTEHNGAFPKANGAVAVSDLLMQYSNIDGTAVSHNKDAARGVIYGPYLRTIPPLTVGQRRGANGISTVGGPGIGWIYKPKTGELRPNSLGKDAKGKPYAQY